MACPCVNYDSIEGVAKELDSDHRAQVLIDWLSSPSGHDGGSTHADGTSRCSRRIVVARAIARHLKQATSKYMNYSEIQQGIGGIGSKSMTATISPSEVGLHMDSLQQFPVLQASTRTTNNNIPAGAIKRKVGKLKRRIRPAMVPAATRMSGNLAMATADDHGTMRHQIKATSNVNPSHNLFNVAKESQEPLAATTIPVGSAREVTWASRTPAAVAVETESSLSVDIVAKAEHDQRLRRLSQVYGKLLGRALMDSTLRELQWLLQLLQCADCSGATLEKEAAEPTSPLDVIFPSPEYCVAFARLMLPRLENVIVALGSPLLDPLLQFAPLQQWMPQWCATLGQARRETATAALVSPMHASLTSNHTALLNLPFDPVRDSRHGFAGHDRTRLYQNREHARDAFMTNLRTFLHGQRAMLDATRAAQARHTVRAECRHIVHNVMRPNLSWLAEFVHAVLLQIGLAPVPETDPELLKKLTPADEERVQQLNRRFFAVTPLPQQHTGGRVGEGGRKLGGRGHHRGRGGGGRGHSGLYGESGGGGSGGNTKSGSPIIAAHQSSHECEAQEHFPGHQEYFFLFITSTDSYSFLEHLFPLLVATLHDTRQATDDGNFACNLLTSKMVARFIGLVAFMPHWGNVDAPGSTAPMPDGVQRLQHHGLDMIAILRQGQRASRLSVEVPWMTECMSMAYWVPSRFESPSYNEVMAAFRVVRSTLLQQTSLAPRHAVTILTIESFFGICGGMARSVLTDAKVMPNYDDPHKNDFAPTALSALDTRPVAVDAALLEAVTDEWNPLIQIMVLPKAAGSRTGLGPSRKVRPSAVNDADAAAVSIPETLPLRVRDTIQTQLRDAFFHQHRELKDICQFVVDHIVRRVVAAERSKNDNVRAGVVVEPALQQQLGPALVDSIRSLTPYNADPRVVQVACDLAVARGLEYAQTLLRAPTSSATTASAASTTVEGAVLPSLLSVETRVGSKAIKPLDVEQKMLVDGLCLATNALQNVVTTTANSRNDALQALERLLNIVQGAPITLRHAMIDPQVFVAILELDDAITATGLLSADDADANMPLLLSLIRVALALTPLCRRGLASVRACCQQEVFLARLCQGELSPELQGVLDGLQQAHWITLAMTNRVQAAAAASSSSFE